ncbi:MAG: hypothetical protein OQJ81_09545, partial [Melioribacteraceae bacterium]|nr:hypothetical protein [Melioribacteraceae bacterium]
TNLINNVETVLNGKLINNYTEWKNALNDAQSILLKNEVVKDGLKKALDIDIDSRIKFQRSVLEVAYTLFPDDLSESVSKIYNATKDPISFVIASHYLLNSEQNNIDKLVVSQKLIEKFPNYKDDEIIKELHNDLSDYNKLVTKPDLAELLSHPFQNGKTIVYSFHRKNRIYPGITIIKKPNGELVKNEDGTIFQIAQLALSYSNLPYYIPNGNTPQGIYSIVGVYISPTETIGPTPNILVRSPFEVSPEIFYHNKNSNSKWNEIDYINLLPSAWKEYEPIYHSYKAGKIGRKLIIMHGSTDETSFFKEFPYYPLTPTKGCLSSKEIWSDLNGKCIESDQAKLVNAFRSVRQKKGFLVVIELDDQNKPISLSEIEKYIKK